MKLIFAVSLVCASLLQSAHAQVPSDASTVPTAPPGTNTIQSANTAFTTAAVGVEASRAEGAETTNAAAGAAAQNTANAALPTTSAGPLATQSGATGSAAISAALGYTPYSASNPSAYITSQEAVAAAPVQTVAGQTGTPTAAQIADHLNATAYGAVMGGASTSLSLARQAADVNGSVYIPNGVLNLNANPSGGPTTPILWRLDGTKYSDDLTPIITIGNDEVETFQGNNGVTLARATTNTSSGSLLTLLGTVTNTGGTPGDIAQQLGVNITIPAEGGPLNSGIWGVSSVIDSWATGPGGHVALNGTARRHANGSQLWSYDGVSIDNVPYRLYNGAGLHRQ